MRAETATSGEDAMHGDNPLEAWRRREGLSLSELAREIGEDRRTVERYLLPRDHARFRMPRPGPMRAIHRVTRGEVTPNHLHGLPAGAPEDAA